MARFLMIVAALSLSVNVWAGELEKSNSLTIEKDSITTSWIATCEISISGVDQRQIYSGRMLFAFESSGQGSTIFDAVFQVDPANRTWTESSPGIYQVTAKLKGRDVTVHAEVSFDSINPGDRIFCSSRIDPGTQPPAVGTTLFEVHTVSTVQQP